jgi:membrane protease YdiL (CAAX protease family)
VKKLILITVVLLTVTLFATPVLAQFDSPLPPPDPNPPPDDGSLSGFLLWLIGGGGAALVAFWLMEKLPLSGLSSEVKRYISLALAVVLACLAFWAAVALNYQEKPGTTKEWIEQLFAIAFLVIVGSQALHGRLRLRVAK